MSLVYYLMAAEAGYAAAQFNAAYICEENGVSCSKMLEGVGFSGDILRVWGLCRTLRLE